MGRITLSQVPKFSMTKSAWQMGHKGRQDLGYGPVERYCMVRASLHPIKLLGYPTKSTERWGGREARIGAHTRKGSTQGGELRRAEMHTGTCIGVYSGRLAPAASSEGDPGINWSPK